MSSLPAYNPVSKYKIQTVKIHFIENDIFFSAISDFAVSWENSGRSVAWSDDSHPRSHTACIDEIHSNQCANGTGIGPKRRHQFAFEHSPRSECHHSQSFEEPMLGCRRTRRWLSDCTRPIFGDANFGSKQLLQGGHQWETFL